MKTSCWNTPRGLSVEKARKNAFTGGEKREKNEPPCPLIAKAAVEDTLKRPVGRRDPYHGYYYRF